MLCSFDAKERWGLRRLILTMGVMGVSCKTMLDSATISRSMTVDIIAYIMVQKKSLTDVGR